MSKESIIESFNTQSETEANKLKVGEIFLLRDCSQILSCIRCWRDFHHYTEFTLHIQEHYYRGEIVPFDQIIKTEKHDDIEEVLLKTEIDQIGNEYDDLTNYTENYDGGVGPSSPVVENCNSYQTRVVSTSEKMNQPNTIPEEPLTDESKKLTCEICGWVSKRKKHLTSHIKTHSDSRVSCEICGKKITAVNIRGHMKTHTHTPDHLCATCGMRFTNKGNLKLHLSVHVQELCYNCDFCSSKFFRSDKLLQHIRSNHNDQIKFHCSTCNIGFMSKKSMVRHENIHLTKPDGNVAFHCEICNVSFKEKQLYRQHKMKHLTKLSRDTNLNFYCGTCYKGFVHKRSVTRHEKKYHPEMMSEKSPKTCYAIPRRKVLATPTSKKASLLKAPCELCGKEVYAHNMNEHKKIHTATKDFLCTICGKGFIKNQLLVQHLITHDQGFKFKCDFCSDKYLRYGQLLAHIRKEHPEAMKFHCITCNMGFMHKVGLTTHERRHLVDGT